MPKGILRLLILRFLSKGPLSGIEIIRQIQRESERLWTPSPGSIYYLLGELASYGEIKEVFSTQRGEKRYLTTPSGLQRLDASASSLRQEVRRILAALALTAADEETGRLLLQICRLALEMPAPSPHSREVLTECANKLRKHA